MFARDTTPVAGQFDNAKGVAWASVAVALFALIFVSGKWSGGVASAAQIIWLRYVGGFVCVVAWAVLRRVRLNSLSTSQLPVHAIRATAGGGGGMAAIYAATNMPVADATAIGLLDGFFTVLLGVFLLKEGFTLRQWGAALVCLAGAMIVVAGDGAGFRLAPETAGAAVVALGGAVLIAVESILIKTLARSERAIVVLLYVNLFGMLLFAGPALWQWQSVPAGLIGAFVLLGPVAIVAQICNIQAFRLSDAALIGPVRYTWIVFGALFGWALFAEVPTTATCLGGVLILFGGAGLAASGRGFTRRRV
ncbi:DMT family transporter [Stappia sp. ES.058]|uniref:DMT family transporter n=1 Tax=Stappia sp. ES.058 TaxID=1881061 RepID=UPI00087A248F|nr:DMT family transporter [Stappia sp. ES.058]SDU30455.1 EamA domain-containing membrane protein RarD [Stappia sp. ES.058]